ncbi:MAG TPA: exo-alpha-sialidase [Planctomycetaceae bacterium]|nr:exo-alpha-sialidase [Planctomycetaceae bacterium]
MPRFPLIRTLFATILAAAAVCAGDARADAPIDHKSLFVSGEGGYHTYRIPAVVVTTKGTVLALCEGRKNSARDTGDIDLLLRRSTDGGKTFGPVQVVWDDGPNTCGNPCPVVDRQTGVVWLLTTHNLGRDHERQIVGRTSKGTRTVWIAKSTDDGLSWSKPVEITDAVKRPGWTWYATGPGAGIQLRDGRLVIPCDHMNFEPREYCSHVIYSDDGGATWTIGGIARPDVNECEVVELLDGQLMLNMRNHRSGRRERAVAISDDRGESWSEVTHDAALVESHCQASIRRHSLASDGGENRLLFSNPADAQERRRMTARMSEDEGRTWPQSRVLHEGPSGYSCLAVLPDGGILCLYERGEKDYRETITLARFSVDWLAGETQ